MEPAADIAAPQQTVGRFPPALLFLSIGFTAELAQVVLFRELLTTFSGSEIAIALILGTWLLWTAAGSFLTNLIPVRSTGVSRPSSSEQPKGCTTNLAEWDYRLYVAATILVCAALPAEIVGIRLLRAWCHLPTGVSIPVSLLFFWSLVLLAPLGLSLGAQFVLGSRLVKGAESVYVAESIGSAGAGFLVSFLLVPAMDSFQLAFLAAIVHLVMAGMVGRSRAAARPDPPSRYLPFALWPLLLVIVASPFAHVLDEKTREAYWQIFFQNPNAPNGGAYSAPKLVEARESAYGSIAVLQSGDQATIYQSGRNVLTASTRPVFMPGVHLCMAEHPSPKRVLLIGGGIAGSLRHVLMHNPEHVDYVEIDPVLVDVAAERVSPEDREALADSRVHQQSADGRAFLRQTADVFDVILVHAPKPTTTQDNRFYTLEFFREAQRRLAPGGILCLGEVQNDTVGQLPDILLRNATIRSTLKQVFKNVLVTAGEQCFFLASDADGLPTADENAIRGRLASRLGDKVKDVNLRQYLSEDELPAIDYALRTGGAYNILGENNLPNRAWPVNTDARPALYYQSIRIQAREDGDARLLSALDFLERLSPGWWAGGAGVAVLAAAVGLPGRRRSLRVRAICFGAFASGLTGMALELMIIFAFQNARGSIYQAVGAIVGMFMLGLALGAELARRVRIRPTLWLLIVQIAMAGFAAAAPLLLALPMRWGIPWAETAAFGGMNFAAGILVGVFFPLAVRSAGDAGTDASAVIYATDLLGGALGALLASTFCLPWFGTHTTSLGCAILSLLGGVLLLSVAWRSIVRPRLI